MSYSNQPEVNTGISLYFVTLVLQIWLRAAYQCRKMGQQHIIVCPNKISYPYRTGTSLDRDMQVPSRYQIRLAESESAVTTNYTTGPWYASGYCVNYYLPAVKLIQFVQCIVPRGRDAMFAKGRWVHGRDSIRVTGDGWHGGASCTYSNKSCEEWTLMQRVLQSLCWNRPRLENQEFISLVHTGDDTQFLTPFVSFRIQVLFFATKYCSKTTRPSRPIFQCERGKWKLACYQSVEAVRGTRPGCYKIVKQWSRPSRPIFQCERGKWKLVCYQTVGAVRGPRPGWE